MKAFGEYIIIVPDSKEKTLASGIIIPDTHKEPPKTGIVHSVGNIASKVSDNTIKETDHIVFREGMGFEVENGGVKMLAITTRDVMAIM